MLEQIMQSEMFSLILEYGFTGIGCTCLGAFLNNQYEQHRNRIQKIMCFYTEDDILSKIPIKSENDTVHNNIHCKKFVIKNTSNNDIKSIKIIFQFDSSAEIIECYSNSKEGWNKQKVKINHEDKNQVDAPIEHFNRGDSIEYTFKVANVSDNRYYITESKCVGFKIVCKDKRKSQKSKSSRSDKLLVERH